MKKIYKKCKNSRARIYTYTQNTDSVTGRSMSSSHPYEKKNQVESINEATTTTTTRTSAAHMLNAAL